MPAILAGREYAATRAAQDAGVPVPAAYELIEMDGRHGIVFEKIEGVSLLADLQAKPWKMFTLARQLGELHAQIHAVRAPVELPSQRQQIEDGISAARGVEDADKEAVLTYLRELPEGESLCHGDFHPDNILLSEQGPVIIDWLTGARGQPLADIARTSLIFQTAGLAPATPIHIRLMIKISRAFLHEQYLKRYLQMRPTECQQINKWRLPLLVARLCEVENYPHEKQQLLQQINSILNKSQ